MCGEKESRALAILEQGAKCKVFEVPEPIYKVPPLSAEPFISARMERRCSL